MDKNDEIIDVHANKGHQGFAIKCIRGLRDMKQSELAEMIKVSESQMYKIERQAIIDEDKLEKIAKALKTDVDTIKSFRTDCKINVNTFYDSSNNNTPQSTNANTNSFNNGISVEKYEMMVDKYEVMINKVIEKERVIAQKDLEICELKSRLGMKNG